MTTEVSSEPALLVTEALCDASREALTNITKHAGVSHAVLRAATRSSGVEITVRDQGGGFDTNVENNGFGIENSIVRRMVEVGGRVEISSTPGSGTRVTLWAPT